MFQDTAENLEMPQDFTETAPEAMDESEDVAPVSAADATLSREEEQAVFAEIYALRRVIGAAVSACPALVEEILRWATIEKNDYRFLTNRILPQKETLAAAPEDSALGASSDDEEAEDGGETQTAPPPALGRLLHDLSRLGVVRDKLNFFAAKRGATEQGGGLGQQMPPSEIEQRLLTEQNEILGSFFFRHRGLASLNACLDHAREEGNLAALDGSAAFLSCFQRQQQLDRKLFESQRRLIHTRALRFVRKNNLRHCDVNDLFMEGCIGFFHAIDTFDVARGNRFSTHMVCWVDSKIGRGMREKDALIRIPAYTMEKLTLINKVRRELFFQKGLQPTTELVAAQTGFDPDFVSDLLQISVMPKSLDAPLMCKGDLDDSLCFLDVLADPSARAPEGAVAQAETNAQIRRILAKHLTARQEIVLTRHLGLDGDPAEPFDAIGKRLFLTRERVRQIEQEAMKRLKTPQVVKKLQGLRGHSRT